jgi:hypothetical protein
MPDLKRELLSKLGWSALHLHFGQPTPLRIQSLASRSVKTATETFLTGWPNAILSPVLFVTYFVFLVPLALLLRPLGVAVFFGPDSSVASYWNHDRNV